MEEISGGFLRALQLIASCNPEVVEITLRTLYIAISSTIICCVFCIPLACSVHFSSFRGKRIFISLIETLYSLPTVTVGLVVYLLLSRSGPLGAFELLFSPSGMIFGQSILITPIIIGLSLSALSGVDPQIWDTAISFGSTRNQAIWTVLVEAKIAVISAILLGFGRALSEVGVAMMIGGNIRGTTRVLTTAIALETSMGNLELSMALGIILISISLLVNMILSSLKVRW
jgi:tungstate transport system permease protein